MYPVVILLQLEVFKEYKSCWAKGTTNKIDECIVTTSGVGAKVEGADS